MAFLRMEFFSETLQKDMSLAIVLPNDLPPAAKQGNSHFARPMKTLYLLHGYTGNCMDWTLNAKLQELACGYNLCIICPDGDNSFYLDGEQTGRKYAQFTGEELVNYTRDTFGLSAKAEDTLIGGLSMGGFGALHTALRYPRTYGGVFGLSSALIQHEVQAMQPGQENGVANYAYYRMVFGDPARLEHSENNPEELVRRLCSTAQAIPPIYMACGTEDFLLKENRAFRDFLVGQGVSVLYHESAGIHDYRFWNQYLEPAVCYLLGQCHATEGEAHTATSKP